MLNILNFFLLLLYFLVFYSYLLDFKRDDNKFFFAKRILLLITLIAYFVFLVWITVKLGHLPITNKFEIFSLISFSVLFTYLLVEVLSDIRGTGFFIVGFGLFFQIISVLFFKIDYQVPAVLKNFPLSSHVVTAILSYTAFSVSAAYAVMYVILFKKLKTGRFDVFFQKLPNLEILEKLSTLASLIGIILLSFAIVIGIIWLPRTFTEFSYFDPKLVSTIVVWLFYGATIIAKFTGNLYGKKLVYSLLLNFIIAVLSVVISSLFHSSFHAFG